MRSAVHSGGRVLSSASRVAINILKRKLQAYKHEKRKRQKSSKPVKTLQRIAEQGQHNSMVSEAFTVSLPSTKPKGTHVGTFRFVNFCNNTFATAVPSGVQLVFTGPEQFNRAQLLALSTQETVSTAAFPAATTANTFSAWRTSPWDMNPYQTQTQSLVLNYIPDPNSVTGRANISDHIHVSPVHVEWNLGNITTISCEVDIYFFLCNTDTSQTPYTAWDEAIAGASQNANVARMAGTSAVGSFGADANSFYGCNPMDYPDMKKKWKLIKKITRILEPGQRDRMHFKYSYNKTLSRTYFENTGIDITYFKGLSIVPLFVVRPAFVHVNKDVVAALDSYIPGYAHVALAERSRYQFGCRNVAEKVSYTRSAPPFYNAIAIGAQQNIDDTDQDTVVDTNV